MGLVRYKLLCHNGVFHSELDRRNKEVRKFSQRVLQWLAYIGVRLFVCVTQAVRIETCEALADFLAWLAHERLRLRHQVIDENIAHAFPQLSPKQRHRLGRAMWRHIFLLACELVHAPRKIHRTNWRDFVRTRNIEDEIRLLWDERPVIVVSGHFGNFEVGGQISALLGYPTYTVARTLDNPWLDRFMNRFREATGQYILPKKGSSFQVDQVLRSGGTLVLLGDQSAGPKGCWINFFGRPASCHKSVALFSLTQNAPMVFAYAKRLGRPMRFELGVLGVYDPEVDGVKDVETLSQWYSGLLEDVVRTAPDQYWWLHRRWKEPPARIKRRLEGGPTRKAEMATG